MADRYRATEITAKKTGGVSVVRVTGELDALAGPQLDEAAIRTMEEGARRCIIDLSGTTFIDSIGVGSLIRCHRAAIERGGSLFLAGPSGMIDQLIKITQLNRVFKIYPTLDEALTIATSEI